MSTMIDTLTPLAHRASRVLGGVAMSASKSVSKFKHGVDASPLFSSVEDLPYLMIRREVRCLNDMCNLQITLINNDHGEGVIVSELGPGSAATAGVCVGDVILYVNGDAVIDHSQCMDLIKHCRSANLVFTLCGSPKKLVIDRCVTTTGAKLNITLTG